MILITTKVKHLPESWRPYPIGKVYYTIGEYFRQCPILFPSTINNHIISVNSIEHVIIHP